MGCKKKYLGHDFEEALCEMFPPQWLHNIAKETGLVKRERKVDPVALFWVLVLSFGVEMQRTLASLKRSYEREGDVVLSDSRRHIPI